MTHLVLALVVLIPASIGIAFPPGNAHLERPSCRRSLEVLTPSGAGTRIVTSKRFRPRSDGPVVRGTSAARWHHVDGGLAYIPTSVAIGDRGALTWVGESLNAERFQLFDSSAIGSVQPVWFDDQFRSSKGDLMVALAAESDLAVGLVHHPDSGGGWLAEIRAFRSGAPHPIWRWSTAASASVAGYLAVTTGGERVVVARQDTSTGQIRLVVLAGNDGRVLLDRRLVDNDVRALEVSADGARIYVASSQTSYLLDGDDGSILFQVGNAGGFSSHSLSADGGTFAFGGFNSVHVYRDVLGDGQYTLWVIESYGGKAYTAVCALDASGRHLAWAAVHYDRFSRYEVFSYEVMTRQRLFQATFQAQGSAQDVPRQIRFAREATRFIVGGWGDEANAHAEVHVFDVADANPIFEIDTVGSVFDVALDAQGRRAVAVSKSVHANRLGNGGEVVTREVTEATLDLRGPVQLGSPFELRAAGWPGGMLSLAISIGESSASQLPGCAESLWLNPATVFWLSRQAVPASGRLSWTLGVPPSAAALVGRRFVTQHVVSDPVRGCWLSNPVFSRVLP